MANNKIRALALTGPTASGKSDLSLALAKRYGAEIIGCDSMQIYKHMDIGTAKPDPTARAAVPHHLVDFLEIGELYSAERYREDTRRALADITKRGRLALFVGGTGLYLDTLTRGESDGVPGSDAEYRDKILASIKTEDDVEALWQRLKAVDPESAEAVHKNNVKRVIRCLEIYDKTGKPKSLWDKESRDKPGDVELCHLTLDFHNRDILYDRIDTRVMQMLDMGLVGEVEALYRAGYLRLADTSSYAIGYKELLGYLSGEEELSSAVSKIKLSTRRYAKRQLTWFRQKSDAYRLYVDNEDGTLRDKNELIEEACSIIDNFLNTPDM
ncbi:MAG: tRNA (adenosine(37)-N6)-dimethylallyltransferase MiaA [Clostridia bacterium]|nr:tRNA (adenosine(37)-N6)-dimethylallyltransferase MiaA [Clostridia bacterium]